MRRIIRKIHKREEGATAVEFAMVSVPLLMLIFGIIEFSLMYTTVSILESATQRVARSQKALAGTTDNDGNAQGNISANAVRGIVVDHSNGFLRTNRLIIATDNLNAADCTGTGSQGTTGGWGGAITVDGSGNMIGSDGRTSGGRRADQLSCGNTGGSSSVIQYRVYYTHHYLIPALGRIMNTFFNAEPTPEGAVLQASTVVQNEPPLVRP